MATLKVKEVSAALRSKGFLEDRVIKFKPEKISKVSYKDWIKRFQKPRSIDPGDILAQEIDALRR